MEKRAAAYGLINMIGNLAQIYTTYMYNEETSPQYLPTIIGK